MMIYWTPLELESVFAGWDERICSAVEIQKDGVLLQVEPQGDGMGKIMRLISGDPNNYLREDLAPGKLVAMQ